MENVKKSKLRALSTHSCHSCRSCRQPFDPNELTWSSDMAFGAGVMLWWFSGLVVRH